MSEELRMKLEVTLACGHTISCYQACDPGDIGRDEAIVEFNELGGRTMSHWLVNRTARHRCELVSQDNPGGLI